MTSVLIPKSNLKVLGRVFRMHRIHKGYSIRGIARSENISHTVISDIENGKVYPNIDTLVSLFKHVGVELWADEEDLFAVYEDLNLLNETVYYREDDYAKNIYARLEEKHDKLFYSLLMVDYTLARCLYKSVYLQDYDNEQLNRLEHFYKHFSTEQKEKFNLIKGTNLFRVYKPQEAINYLKRNLELNGNQKAVAISLSYISESYKHLFHAYNAIDYGKQASEKHGANANLVRKIRSDAVVIDMLIDMERFEEAQQLLNSLTLTIDETELEMTPTRRYFDFLKPYMLFRQGKPKDAYDVLIKQEYKIPSYYFFKAEILLALKRHDEAADVLDKSLTYDFVQADFVYSRLNKLFYHYLKQEFNVGNYEDLIDELLEKPHFFEDFMVFRFACQIGIAFYEANKNYVKALEFAKKCMNISVLGFDANQNRL